MNDGWQTFEERVYSWKCMIDSAYQSSLDLLKINPFTELTMDNKITNTVRGIALTLVSLFFIAQFCNEAMNLRVQSYEQVFRLSFRFVLGKVLVDNASGLMGIIYTSFNGIAVSISTECYGFMSKFSIDSLISKPDKPGFADLNYTLALITSFPTFLILLGACWVISLVLIGRLFEVMIYTIIAPIPLATFAGEGWTESVKNFIKNYAAVCLQGLVIIVMFNAFSEISTLAHTIVITREPDGTTTQNTIEGLNMTVTALALALGVSKSGQWARQAVGL